VTLLQLEYFVKVAECGGFVAAAEALRLTQPNLSRQVKQLEEEWGWRLFVREGRRMKLTCEGEVALKEAKKILKSVHQGVRQMKAINGSYQLRIGYAPSLTSDLLGKVVESFSKEEPEVRIKLLDLSSEEMVKGLRDQDLDFILSVMDEDERVDWLPIRTVDLKAVMPRDHDLAKESVVKSSQLNGERLLMFSRTDYAKYWEDVTAYFQQNDVNARVAGEFDGVDSLLTALLAKLGIALLARDSIQHHVDKLEIRDLSPEIPTMRVGLGFSSEQALDPVSARFVEHFQNFIGQTV